MASEMTRRQGTGRSLSVTIVNAASRDLLRECLRVLEENPYTLGPMEIVVLDNASGDGSIAMLREEFPGVEVLEEDHRRGFGANQNRAVAQSTGELIFLLNPDATILPETIDALARSLDWAPDVVAAGGPVLTEAGTAIHTRPFPPRSLSGAFAGALGMSRGANRRPAADGVFRDGWLSGGAFLITRRAFELLGGFDEAYFMYAEDTDLFTRLVDRGFAFSWVVEAGTVHPKPTESRAMSRRRAVEMVRGDSRYMQKHSGPAAAAAYRLATALDSTVRLAALRTPWAARFVSLHDAGIDYNRFVYRSRIRAALLPQSGAGIAELAQEWNDRAQGSGDRAPG